MFLGIKYHYNQPKTPQFVNSFDSLSETLQNQSLFSSKIIAQNLSRAIPTQPSLQQQTRLVSGYFPAQTHGVITLVIAGKPADTQSCPTGCHKGRNGHFGGFYTGSKTQANTLQTPPANNIKTGLFVHLFFAVERIHS